MTVHELQSRAKRAREALYDRRVIGRRFVETRYGSSVLGVCVVVLRTPSMPPNWIVQIGRLTVSGGPAGGVEEGLAGIQRDLRGRTRVFYRPEGLAVATHLERRP